MGFGQKFFDFGDQLGIREGFGNIGVGDQSQALGNFNFTPFGGYKYDFDIPVSGV
jgi:hypothetical protein